MKQEQADRMEEMISTLITMMGSFKSEIRSEITEVKAEITGVKSEVIELKTEITEIKTEINEMKTEIDGIINSQLSMQEELRQMREENNGRHSEIISRFEILEANQEHTWEKTVMNERDIAVMKKLAK